MKVVGLVFLAGLLLPVLGLLVGIEPSWAAVASDGGVRSAVAVSLGTSLVSVALTVLGGTPLAWWMARNDRPWVRPLVVLPVVLPPAVLGVALLETFGRQGLVGSALASLGLALPFTSGAVVVAQVMVAGPLYVLAAEDAFRAIDDEVLLVARTLGATPAEVARRVVWPLARPGLLGGVGLAWTRALGEFGATLLFAGNLPGRTTTLPLLIYTALETRPEVARATAVGLLMVTVALLTVLGSGRRR